MKTAQLRAQLHEYIENADERLLHLVHGLFAADMQERDWGNDDLHPNIDASLKRAKGQLDNGQGRSHEAVMKAFRAKYQV